MRAPNLVAYGHQSHLFEFQKSLCLGIIPKLKLQFALKVFFSLLNPFNLKRCTLCRTRLKRTKLQIILLRTKQEHINLKP